MAKQTAVEWLVNVVKSNIANIPSQVVEQALAMEKQQRELMFTEQEMIEAIVRASNSKTELILDRCIEIIKTIKDK